MPTIRAASLASGSKGNSLFIESGDVRLLVDAGLSCRQIELRLEQLNVPAASINAIFITHEHIDHIRALRVFQKKYATPVYVSPKAASHDFYGNRLDDFLQHQHPIAAGEDVVLGDITIKPFSISHDAADPLGFRFEVGELAVAIATDLGIVTRLVCDRLNGCAALFCESNHDVAMLANGPYPMRLKKRIRGKFGHLSNADCRQLLENVYHPHLRYVTLSHLSEKNNTPQLAFQETKTFLNKIDSTANLLISRQDQVGTLIELG